MTTETTTDTVAPALTELEARRLTARIRDALALADDLLAQAFTGGAWKALRHPSWEAYCAAELPGMRMLRLSKFAQTEKFTAHAQAGMSTHAIAALSASRRAPCATASRVSRSRRR